MRFWPLWLAPLVVSAYHLGEPTQDSGTVIPRSLASSVQLFAERADGARRAGSGIVFSVDPKGRALVLTTAHLLEPPVQQSVQVFEPRSGQRVQGRIVTVDAAADIAVVEASGLEVRPVEFKAEARLGDDVWVVSFPWGGRGTVVDGVVSQIAGDETEALPTEGPVGLINAAVSSGASGGGVFDRRSGDLVGIVRGYRTTKLSVAWPNPQTLEFPMAGGTTVIPTPVILCLLRRADLGDRLPAAITRSAHSVQSCPDA